MTLIKGKKSQYELIQFIGKGSISQVALAEDTNSGIKYAVKVVKQETCLNKSKNIYYEREYEISLYIHNNQRKDNSSLVKIIEVIKDRDQFFVIMEYMPNGNLSEFINQSKGVIAESEIYNFVQQLAQGLLELEEMKVIHRDLKPENILVKVEQGKQIFKIADFGLSKVIQSKQKLSQLASMVGTLSYMAPEMYDNNYDKQIDIWSFGCILYEMTRKKQLFKSEPNNLKLMLSKINKYGQELKNSSSQSIFDQLINGCLNLDPNKRPTPKDFIKKIDSIHNNIYDSYDDDWNDSSKKTNDKMDDSLNCNQSFEKSASSFLDRSKVQFNSNESMTLDHIDALELNQYSLNKTISYIDFYEKKYGDIQLEKKLQSFDDDIMKLLQQNDINKSYNDAIKIIQSHSNAFEMIKMIYTQMQKVKRNDDQKSINSNNNSSLNSKFFKYEEYSTKFKLDFKDRFPLYRIFALNLDIDKNINFTSTVEQSTFLKLNLFIQILVNSYYNKSTSFESIIIFFIFFSKKAQINNDPEIDILKLWTFFIQLIQLAKKSDLQEQNRDKNFFLCLENMLQNEEFQIEVRKFADLIIQFPKKSNNNSNKKFELCGQEITYFSEIFQQEERQNEQTNSIHPFTKIFYKIQDGEGFIFLSAQQRNQIINTPVKYSHQRI